MMSRVWGWIYRCWTQPLLAGAILYLVFLPVTAAESSGSLAGTYRDDQMTVELAQSASAPNGSSYTGSIQFGEQKFPLTAEAEGNRLKGTFQSEGVSFEFTASVAGRMLVLTSGGTTYRLTKQTANPLARPTPKPNPLSQRRTNAPAALPPTMQPVPAPAVVSGNVLRLTRTSVMDDPSMIGGEAFSLLLPPDWQIEGGLAWRIHPTVPAYIALRVSSPDRTESLEAFPALMFVWAEEGIPLRPPGSFYMGNEVAEPLKDPIAYIRQVLLPRFRKNLPLPQVVGTEELPKLAETISLNMQEPGLQKTFRAARLRLEYVENGRTIQEDVYCVLSTVYAPAIKTTFWGPDRNYAFKAEKGKLDARTKVLQSIFSSIRPNLQWFNRYVQLLPALAQGQIEAVRHVNEFGAYVKAGTTDQITEPRRQAYQRQQASQELVNASLIQYCRGIQEYRLPGDGRRVLLPAYPGIWVNARGDVLLSDEMSFSPNAGSSKEWQRVEVNR
jgi:hypothetical protein